jgi:hypothetical protein
MAGAGRVRKRGWFGVVLAGALAMLPLAGAAAGEAPGYAERAKAVIAGLLTGRDFTPETGCGGEAPCAGLLARLRAGDFTVMAPAESSDRPDLPSYLRLRKRCPGIDPARVTVAHHTFSATRNFAAYRLDGPRPQRKGEEILVFRAQHFVVRDGAAAEAVTLLPGTFVAVSLPGCRMLATARSEEGDWFAKHNEVEETDHASELLRLDGRYVVLNIVPVAAPRQPKSSWWYTLELWDLGAHADADRRHERRVYAFRYKPGAAASGTSRAVGTPPWPG